MHIEISPLTPYNSFCKEPNGLYVASCVIDNNSYTPTRSFEEDEIPYTIENLKELLKYFKGNHTISITKLVKCTPYEFKPTYGNRDIQMRDWTTESGESFEIVIDKPKIAKVCAENSKGAYGAKGWFIKVNFGIADICVYDFGVVCSSFKRAKEYAEFSISKNTSIIHWIFEDMRKARKVKCNSCGQELTNLTAEQCSECGKYFCPDCLTDSVCSDCGFED
jgi:hypothetical protein